MTLPATEPPADAAAAVELLLSRCDGRFDWRLIFGNSNPVEIEIGCGKGRFIIGSSRAHPDTNYVGIERAGKFFRILKQRVVSAQARNIRIIRSDALYVLRKYVPPESLRACHLYFPDPWPKKRHHKRRLVSTESIALLTGVLEPGGRLCFATDFKDYFDVMTECARGRPELREVVYAVVLPGTTDPEQAPTHYERKYLLQGRTIYKAVYQKTGDAQ